LINLIPTFVGRFYMITETLQPRLTSKTVIFQTQLLKLYFTTLYVDVKEPARHCCLLKSGFGNLFLPSDSKRLFLLLPNAALQPVSLSARWA